MIRSTVFAIALGLVAVASNASAQATGTDTLNRFSQPGQFQVQTMSGNGFTLFLPLNRPAGSPIITWGNGTGGAPSDYTGLLTQWASYGIIVVASTSANTGTGSQMVTGIGVAQ